MRLAKIFKRVLLVLPIMFGVAIAVFLFMRLSSGDPVDLLMGKDGHVSQAEQDALRQEFHLDKPLHEQLGIFLSGAVRGNLGNSYVKHQPVTKLIGDTLPATIELAVAALFLALLISIPIGILSAVKQNSLIDKLSMGTSFLGISMPNFWLGIVLMLLFAVKLRWFPVMGRLGSSVYLQKITGFYVLDSILTGNGPALASALKHLALPAITLSAEMAAVMARVTRSNMLEALRQDYVLMARAKGVREFFVVVKHAFRNALIPATTVTGMQLGALLGGNMIVETVFGWPGIGRLTVDAIFARDFPLVQGVVMVYALVYVLANLVTDVLYTVLNPKIEM